MSKVEIVGLIPINKQWIDAHPDLELIIKRGIGVDNFDLGYCKEKGIIVCNTPDAPSNAVAELTICQMMNMLRKVQNVSNQVIRKERWNRYIGRELRDCKVGIIGLGRCGNLVAFKLTRMTGHNMLWFNDIKPNQTEYGYKPLDYILKNCDVITIHIPLKDKGIDNTDFISKKELDMMKPNVRLLNLSRGGIINEDDLYNWLKDNKKACVALDSFVNEAYEGVLCELGNVYLTPHMASCTETSKKAMMNEAEFIKERYLLIGKVRNRVL